MQEITRGVAAATGGEVKVMDLADPRASASFSQVRVVATLLLCNRAR